MFDLSNKTTCRPMAVIRFARQSRTKDVTNKIAHIIRSNHSPTEADLISQIRRDAADMLSRFTVEDGE